VLASLSHLSDRFSAHRFLLVGWSFGGAPCFEASARDTRVRGVATVASQTAQTEGIEKLPPRPLLLLHGSDDSVLSPLCAHRLYDAYSRAARRSGKPGDNAGLKLFEGDDHGLTRHSEEAETALFEFAQRTLGVSLMDVPATVSGEEREGMKRANLVGDLEDRIESMERGHDLEGPERI
jgi:dienelactone hydrolase